MAGKIFEHDCYSLMKFNYLNWGGKIDTFLDIGANKGSVSLMAKIIMPTARIIALEPNPDIFNQTKKLLSPWGIECYPYALGDGNQMCYIPKKHSGLGRFCTKEEEGFWPVNQPRIFAQSFSLADLFKKFKLSQNNNFIIKCDCEGGERFLLNEESQKIISKSLMFIAELHSGFGGAGKTWNRWLECFHDTHDLFKGQWEYNNEEGTRQFIFTECEGSLFFGRGYQQVQLLKRDFIDLWKDFICNWQE